MLLDKKRPCPDSDEQGLARRCGTDVPISGVHFRQNVSIKFYLIVFLGSKMKFYEYLKIRDATHRNDQKIYILRT